MLDKLENFVLVNDLPLRFNDPKDQYDVIVCGAGHAGCEAAIVAAKQDAKVYL